MPLVATLNWFVCGPKPMHVVEVVVNTNPFPFANLNIFVLRMLETPVIMRSCRLWSMHVHILASRILDYFAKRNSNSLRKIVDFALGVPPNRGPIKEGKKHKKNVWGVPPSHLKNRQKTLQGCLRWYAGIEYRAVGRRIMRHFSYWVHYDFRIAI